MKKQFIARGQTRFRIPATSTNKDGTIRRYLKSFSLPVGHEVVVRDTNTIEEEGHSAVYEVWENDSGTLYRRIKTHSSDCDGHYSGHREQRLEDGAAWFTIEEGQRDHSAEAMGY